MGFLVTPQKQRKQRKQRKQQKQQKQRKQQKQCKPSSITDIVGSISSSQHSSNRSGVAAAGQSDGRGSMCNRSRVQVVVMYLKKNAQELQMQLMHRWPEVVDKVIDRTYQWEQDNQGQQHHSQ